MDKKLVGSVIELFISVSGEKNRIKKDDLVLDEKGVFDDKFYEKDPQRAILLASKSSYELAKENTIDIKYGELGENILIDFNPYSLNVGDKLQIGEVLFEISQPCTLCNGLSKVNNKLPKLLKDDRGIFISASSKGVVKKGDNVYLID